MVGLTELNSNKCNALLRFKKQLPKCNKKAIATGGPTSIGRSVDEFGEITVKCLQQSFRIAFSDSEVAMIISAYQSGQSTYDIAEQFDCCKNTISDLLKRHGINVTNRKIQTRLPVGEVIRMYEGMNTMEKIAQHFGVSTSSIRNCLRKNGVKIRGRWDYT